MAAADNITTFLIRHVLLLRIQGLARLGHSVCPPLTTSKSSIADSHPRASALAIGDYKYEFSPTL
ncbi:hypothetical protein JCM18900_12369 [Psychrobacter sp. JCM 18900]|nr:hypothetical protein JCM18900_12369 [Psychrobacter sp. JCM 18900]